MPLLPPALDNRRYQEILEEALARIPVHTPEWTNFSPSDPGVTLIEVFAFLTESILYRANQIPERNRVKFLQLLGVPLNSAASARGILSIANENGPLATVPLNAGLEARAGEIPFRTDRGLDVLPLETRLYYKRPVSDPSGSLGKHYNLLYASLKQEDAAAAGELALYETVAFEGRDERGISPGEETVDGCLWLALLARPADALQPDKAKLREDIRARIAGKTLSLGVVPALAEADRRLEPSGSAARDGSLLQFQIPSVRQGGAAPAEAGARQARYRSLDPRSSMDVLLEPGVVELTLPGKAEELRLWEDLDPLESGTGNFPPALDDSNLEDRVVTWLRISSTGVKPRLLWLGINAIMATQRDHHSSEVLANGTGEPDQVRRLAHPPVVAESVRIYVSGADGSWEPWQRIDDLSAAPAEVARSNPRLPPGAAVSRTADPEPSNPRERKRPADVFTVDPESGEIRFGDGFRGRRPPPGARIRAAYDHSRGEAGNVGAGAVNAAPSLPPGFKVTNPVRTWGGAAAESVAEGEKQVPRFLQHRDRLVTATDFDAVALRTPGIDIGRVEVLPAFNPDIAPDAPGNAPGAVTLMLVPRFDPAHPDTPEPDRMFLNAVCRHLDPRRLVTTELILRGPDYQGIWITAGIEVLALGRSAPEVREDVKRRLLDFLSPLRETGLADPAEALTTPEYADMRKGWPLRKAVSARELMAVASRVPGVRLVNRVRLADATGQELDEVPLERLQLPRVAGIAVALGDAPAPSDLISSVPAAGPGGAVTTRIVPVPVIPEEC